MRYALACACTVLAVSALALYFAGWLVWSSPATSSLMVRLRACDTVARSEAYLPSALPLQHTIQLVPQDGDTWSLWRRYHSGLDAESSNIRQEEEG